MKIQINDANYQYYKSIFEIIESHLRRLYRPKVSHDESNPIKVLERWELKSKTIAKRGLKTGLQDLISQIKEFPKDLKTAIDADLLQNNLPTLKELQGVSVKIIERVLKRQQIRTLEEFYAIKEEVIDLNSNLTTENRLLLDKCLTEFEFSKRRKNGR